MIVSYQYAIQKVTFTTKHTHWRAFC